MDRCAWQGAEAGFEGVWSSNSAGWAAVYTRIQRLGSRLESSRSLNTGLMLPILQPRCGWDSLGVEPQRFALEQDNPVTRAILLTLSGEQDPSNRPSDGCSLHGTGLIPPGEPRAGSPRCPDPTADRKLDQEATRWLNAYRQDLD